MIPPPPLPLPYWPQSKKEKKSTMEVARGRRFSNGSSRDTTSSPERTKHRSPSSSVVVKPTFKRVQVVYYLSRNGHLEHPHFMEVTHLSHHHLRLKDVIDRLMTLRGKAMPSLYSWSCKRSYKNGYVWNDLAENDVIPLSSDQPGAPAEYVLKGSELLTDHTEKFQQLQVTNRSRVLQVPDATADFTPKRKSGAAKRQLELQEDEYGDERDQEETGSVTPHHYTRCSRGVSTEVQEEEEETESTRKTGPSTELTLGNSSPPSTASSTLSDKGNENNASIRFEDGDPVPAESSLSRNSMLLQLISCGGSASFRKASVPVVGNVGKPAGVAAMVGKSGGGSGLHKGVLCKAAAVAAEEVDEDDEMIKCMSENPRFGNFQAEEKEYFSGSIAESIVEVRAEVEASFKRSNSYNEERSSKAINEAAGGAGEEEKEVKREKATTGVMRGKCIPMNLMKPSSSKNPKK